MKNIIKSLAMAVIAIAFASCQKMEIEDEAQVSQSSAIIVDIKMCDLNTGNADTKAPKTGWADGDIVNIWYESNLTVKPDLAIVYKNGKWDVDPSVATSGKKPAASGIMHVMYIQGGSVSQYMELGTTSVSGVSYTALKFKKSTTTVDSKNKAAIVPMTAYAGHINYTFTSNKLSAEVKSLNFLNNTHIVITGLPSGNWALAGDVFRPRETIYVKDGGFAVPYSSIANGNYVYGVQESDGMAFCFNAIQTDGPFFFALVNTDTGKKLYYQVKGKTVSTDIQTQNAVKMKYANFISSPEAVDLGLSVKWASANLGASSISDFGLYYQWGDTQGYGSDVSDGMVFYWTKTYVIGSGHVYKWFGSDAGLYGGMTKYVPNDQPYSGYRSFTDGKSRLEPGDDASSVCLGGKWHTPSAAEWEELMNEDNCTWTWTTIGGAKGYEVKSKKAGYTNNWIFLPTTGYRRMNDSTMQDEIGLIWSSTLAPDDAKRASIAYMHSGSVKIDNRERFFGLPIRPVMTK